MDVNSNERCDSVNLNHLLGFLSRWTLIERCIGLCPFERCPFEQNLPVRMDVSSNGSLLSADLDIVQQNAHSTLQEQAGRLKTSLQQVWILHNIVLFYLPSNRPVPAQPHNPAKTFPK